MSRGPKDVATDGGATEDFSGCHAGIVSQLDALAELRATAGSAVRASAIANAALRLFDDAVEQHHADEERELIPVLEGSVSGGADAWRVRRLGARIVSEHRRLEALWGTLRPQLRRVARGQSDLVDDEAIARLITGYRAHADFEEREFLPLASRILARRSAALGALGLTLHVRSRRDDLPPWL